MLEKIKSGFVRFVRSKWYVSIYVLLALWCAHGMYLAYQRESFFGVGINGVSFGFNLASILYFWMMREQQQLTDSVFEGWRKSNQSLHDIIEIIEEADKKAKKKK
jgi:hypothetical protein